MPTLAKHSAKEEKENVVLGCAKMKMDSKSLVVVLFSDLVIVISVIYILFRISVFVLSTVQPF